MPYCKWCEEHHSEKDMGHEIDLKRLIIDDGILVLETITIHRCNETGWLSHEILSSERVF